MGVARRRLSKVCTYEHALVRVCVRVCLVLFFSWCAQTGVHSLLLPVLGSVASSSCLITANEGVRIENVLSVGQVA